MKKIKVGVVGLGHRGRHMANLAKSAFEFVDFVAACDIDPELWHEKQWIQDDSMKNKHPGTKFYDDYVKMLDENQFDFILVETGADVHADFCIKALNRGSYAKAYAGEEKGNKLKLKVNSFGNAVGD